MKTLVNLVWSFIFITLLAIQVNAGGLLSDHIKIFVEPPEKAYEELGLIESETDIDEPETILIKYVATKLKIQTRKLGGDAFIIKNISRIPVVYEDPADYNKTPSVITHMLKMRLKVKAIAIKFTQ